MRIEELVWNEDTILHIAEHNVTPEEVEEACDNRPFILKGRGGLHLFYSQTNAGRYLLVVARYKGRGIIQIITARDMTESEKKLCIKRRK